VARLDLSVDARRAYAERLTNAEGAARRIGSGDQIWIPIGHAPIAVLGAIAAREQELRGVKIRAALIPDLGWFRPEAREHFDLQVQFAILPDNRKALDEKLIDLHLFSMIRQHKAIDTGREEGEPIDHLLLVVSPPDERGWLCVGNSVWDAVTTARRARHVIAEVNESVPRTCGDSWLHVSQFDALVEAHRPPVALPSPADFSATDRAIAAHVKTLVRDGDTLQVGLGSHSGALARLGAFDDAEDLGFFSELTVPGIVDLVKRGNITSRFAEVHPHRVVACHIGNSVEDIAYIAGNPMFECHSYEHTNDPRTIARHERMLAINGALMVDLSGQIGVYAIGGRVYTGLGGHLGFAIGAMLSERGRYVAVLPSSARGGAISTIVPRFVEGQIVSVPRELADTVVTEHGIARLLGKSVRERAAALVEIAHPDFRPDLKKAAEEMYGL
jgi:4-hydroxybutyrate CoA-transferase